MQGDASVENGIGSIEIGNQPDIAGLEQSELLEESSQQRIMHQMENRSRRRIHKPNPLGDDFQLYAVTESGRNLSEP